MPAAAADIAGNLLFKLAKNTVLNSAYYPGAITVAASVCGRPWCRQVSHATGACLVSSNVNFLLYTKGRLLEGDSYSVLKVVTSRAIILTTTAKPAKKCIENIPDATLEVETIKPSSRESTIRIDIYAAELVIHVPFLGIY